MISSKEVGKGEGFESNQSGIETQHTLGHMNLVAAFESNQSGIETPYRGGIGIFRHGFESNQSGIETCNYADP